MTAERDDEKFAQLVDALGPYLARVVIVGGWARRLFRNHPLAQTLPYVPLMSATSHAVRSSIRMARGPAKSWRSRNLAWMATA